MKRLLILVMLLGALFLAGCAEAGDPTGDSESAAPNASTDGVGERVSVAGGSYIRVSPAELRVMLEDKEFTFVNTHVPFEGNIPGTDLSIPYNEIAQNLDQLPADKDARIVLYCLGGPMSVSAANTLVELGYTNVWDLKGGMEAWEEAGFPLEDA